MEKLTLKQKKFCEFYVGSGNASEAARLAGYSAKTARATGAENLTKPDVQEYINSLTKAMSDASIACAIERQRFWTAIMRGQMPEVESLQIKASEILGRAQGDFIQKVEVTNDLATLTDDELDEKIRILTAMLM